MELLADHRSVDGAARAVHGHADLLDGDLFEGDAGDVLGSVHVADLRVAGHDHRGGSVEAGAPGALGRMRERRHDQIDPLLVRRRACDG
jgi:hypothetical protein